VLNGLGHPAFVSALGPMFEDSPWIAEQTWSKRPFKDLKAIHSALCETVRSSALEAQLSLIRAHPDLVSRAAMAGTLSPASTSEQASAGLDRLTAEEIALFQKYNNQYREKFGFPFVICARLNKKEAILGGFVLRLNNSREAEIHTALEEIFKIAWLRLSDVLSD
jgi:OHCU decarboxylase